MAYAHIVACRKLRDHLKGIVSLSGTLVRADKKEWMAMGSVADWIDHVGWKKPSGSFGSHAMLVLD